MLKLLIIALSYSLAVSVSYNPSNNYYPSNIYEFYILIQSINTQLDNTLKASISSGTSQLYTLAYSFQTTQSQAIIDMQQVVRQTMQNTYPLFNSEAQVSEKAIQQAIHTYIIDETNSYEAAINTIQTKVNTAITAYFAEMNTMISRYKSVLTAKYTYKPSQTGNDQTPVARK